MTLGFTWDTSELDIDLARHTRERAVWRMRRTMPGFVWDAAVLEGNPFTYPDVQTLMEGVTVGGHRLSNERQVLALADSMRELAYGSHILPEPGPGGENLIRLHSEGLTDILELPDPVQQGIAYFLFAALNQFYFDGNRRTGRAMMNGHLMSCGIDAISVPALRRREFNTLMVDFYRSKDATGIFGLLLSCHPDRLTA
ncbi:hypothetical protein ABIA39_006751 [Nocardia sp. GAS34]|uniref:cell filamentation protein Fic n=1 Tax=unclassified Nocardia TaxID=2637762 RepID=UPI003D2591D3